MGDIAWSVGFVLCVYVFAGDVAQGLYHLVEVGGVTAGDVVYLVDCLVVGGEQCEQVGVDGVVDEGKIAAKGSVAVEGGCNVVFEALEELRDDGGIGSVGALSGSEDVEVPESDHLNVVQFGVHVGVQFVDEFGYGVRGEGFSDVLFSFGQCGVVAVGRGGCCENDSFDAI